MKRKDKIFNILNHIEEIIVVAMFAAMVLIIFIQVIMRKANNSLVWSEELGKFLFVWISWLGISIGQHRIQEPVNIRTVHPLHRHLQIALPQFHTGHHVSVQKMIPAKG